MDVLDGVDPKEFKKLWTQPVKDGWKARPPTGLNVGLTYTRTVLNKVVGLMVLLLRLQNKAVGPVVLRLRLQRSGGVIPAATEQDWKS
eukprot:jgi/Phyca11/106701/e_gw1.12.835.1